MTKIYHKKDLINKIKQAGLIGRGGGCYPVADKWLAVAEAGGKDKGTSYVVCNASEGEPGVKKDHFLLKHHTDRVMDGIKLAVDYLGASKAYIYINPDYYKTFRPKLKPLIGKYPIEIFKKPHGAGYVGGEETSALNSLEGRRIEPRLRPPYPPTAGLWGAPTLVNNVETFYNVSLAVSGEYHYKRFYTINGDCTWGGVYEFGEDWTIAKVLEETRNLPTFKFFVQVGGDGSGMILNSNQLNQPAGGSASITIYSLLKHDPIRLIKKWVYFFYNESCGQCAPCREGLYRLKEIIDSPVPDWRTFSNLLDNLSETSFCGLGCAAPIAIHSYVDNVLSLYPDERIKIAPGVRKLICECFK